MISKTDYQLMKQLIQKYEDGDLPSDNSPYIVTYHVETNRNYNPNFGDDRICECGHTYYRHFDSYDHMEPCGCKYCQCYSFTLAKSEIRQDKLNKIGI